jgi:hypothetical protein
VLRGWYGDRLQKKTYRGHSFLVSQVTSLTIVIATVREE